MNRSLFIAISLMLAMVACHHKTLTAKSKQLYNEPHRPLYHFSPPQNWMNDPNGLVYYEGEYHLFYQYHPFGNTWGPMHWGHAVSTDLVRWQHHPIALSPDSLGYIFSGSAVVDRNNTSGFGKKERPALVAIYTYHSMEGEKAGRLDFQNQGIAYSLDKGRTWTKYSGNPVLKNPGIKDFRDPKVIWHEDSRSWVMVLAAKDKVSFYTSPDLINWTFRNDFRPAWAAYGGVWECPDLFPLKTAAGREKWVLLVSINPGAPNGGSGTQYFVGEFDGKKFQPDSSAVKWLDYGTDNYAGVTWSDIPERDGRRLFIGWMSNWLYAQTVPTEVWRSAMTLPRVLSLQETDGDYRLLSNPVRELIGLRESTAEVHGSKLSLRSDCLEMELEAKASDFQLLFSNAANEKLMLKKTGDLITLDRSQSGIVGFNGDFAKLQTAPARGLNIKKIKVYIDRSSVEFFFNEGVLTMTALIFPKSPFTSLEMQGIKEQAIIHQLNSIWTKGDAKR